MDNDDPFVICIDCRSDNGVNSVVCKPILWMSGEKKDNEQEEGWEQKSFVRDGKTTETW